MLEQVLIGHLCSVGAGVDWSSRQCCQGSVGAGVHWSSVQCWGRCLQVTRIVLGQVFTGHQGSVGTGVHWL